MTHWIDRYQEATEAELLQRLGRGSLLAPHRSPKMADEADHDRACEECRPPAGGRD